jgi:hypothetical protein
MTIEPLQSLRGSDTGPGAITSAIHRAAQQSGLDFDLLLGVAKRESSLDPGARAATSSASGLFQFIDQTWLGALKAHGEELGLGDAAKDIVATENGFTVADPARRQEILDMRFRPAVAARVAGKTLSAAKDRLTQALGREVSGSEVYMAHFLGERGAVRMLNAGEGAVAAGVDPRAANANKPLFFEGGRALSVAEFKDKLALKLGMEPVPAPADAPVYAGPLAPVSDGPARPAGPVPTRPSTPSPAAIVTGPKSGGGAPANAPFGRNIAPQIFASILDMQADFIRGEAEETTSSILSRTGEPGRTS